MVVSRTLALLAVAALLTALPSLVFAQQVPPHAFIGTVTSTDGSPAPDGTQVTAWVDGAQASATTVSDGRYLIQVEQPEGASFAGKTVSFRIGGVPANETATWEQGGATELNLTASTAAPGAGTMVRLQEMPGLGQYLADSQGMALYLFTNDDQETATSNCSGGCAGVWPPLFTTGDPQAGAGLNPSLLGTTQRADGSTQITYNGWPLYYYVRDQDPADILGQDRGGVWFLVTPAGEAIQEWSITVPLEELNSSGQSGTATLTAMGTQTQVTVEVTPGPEADDPQPIHVHLGQCGPTLGAVNVDLTGGNTTGVVAGSLTATVDDVTLISLADGDHAVNLHKSQAEIATYTACGNIPRIGAGLHVKKALAPLLSTDRVEIASAFNYRMRTFESFVPDQPENTLTAVRPNSVIVVTFTEDTTVTIGGNTFTVMAGVPTPLPVGADPTIAVATQTQ